VRLAGAIGQSGWTPYAGAQVIHDNEAKVRELGAHFRRTLPQPTDPRPPSIDELAERARARRRR
jgi:hypothetical protein